MVNEMRRVLETDAGALVDARGERHGKSAARVIGEALAEAAMNGDVKAVAMLMELAGTDFRSRDSEEKHELDRQKLNMSVKDAPRVVLCDERPE
ncbi:MAG: hypothetical protein IKR85_10065 [Clostridia bacterium]|nr:hypothetical protein [Clostridia bacterium]